MPRLPGVPVVLTVDSPYTREGTWLRGNLHAHSTRSDGDRAPERVIGDYAARGYDFLAVSDHDTFLDPEEYRPEAGMVLLPAVEVSDHDPHMLHIGATYAVDSRPNRARVVDEIDDDEGFAVAAHPNWRREFDHWSYEQLAGLGATGIEVYNGLIEGHHGAATATDRWDRLLGDGHRVWGFANDDSHRPWEVARGWNVVKAAERTPAAVLAALTEGRFYASTGVTIREIGVDGGEIVVETDDAHRIELVADYGLVQRSVSASTATFSLPEDLVHDAAPETDAGASYVRLECHGAGTERAWSQPLFLER